MFPESFYQFQRSGIRICRRGQNGRNCGGNSRSPSYSGQGGPQQGCYQGPQLYTTLCSGKTEKILSLFHIIGEMLVNLSTKNLTMKK